MDYYAILGVDKNASIDDIKKTYKKLVIKYHPDKNKAPDAKEKFNQIQEAYSVLSDENKRKQYDSLGYDAFKNGFQGGNGYDFSDFGDINDIFKNMFSGFGGGFGNNSKQTDSYRGDDLRYKLDITLEDAFNGLKKNIKLPKKVKCVDCNGLGYAPKSEIKVCNYCNGKGARVFQQGPFHFQQACEHCNGKGKNYKACNTCHSQGGVVKNIDISIDIPCGVRDNDKLRYAGEGNFGFGSNGESGDLWIFIHIIKHNVFQVEGQNLIVNVPIPVFDAVLGCEFEIPGIDKKMIKVVVPEGLQTNQVITIKDEGMKYYNQNKRGDLIINFKFEIPKKLNSDEKVMCEDIRAILAKKSKSKGIWDKIWG